MKNTIFSRKSPFGIVLLLMLGGLLHIQFGCQSGPPEGSFAKQAQRGEAIFKEQCASCHGMGDMAPTVDTLTVEAPNLALINKRWNVKEFPVGEVARIIDGRKQVQAHGPRQMPVWGEVYEEGGMTEGEIKGRKGELIAYLMSIQE